MDAEKKELLLELDRQNTISELEEVFNSLMRFNGIPDSEEPGEIPPEVFESDEYEWVCAMVDKWFDLWFEIQHGKIIDSFSFSGSLSNEMDRTYLRNVINLHWARRVKVSELKYKVFAYLEEMPDGCETSVLDGEGVPITVDAQRKDLDNFRSLIDMMEAASYPQIQFRDKANNNQLVTLEEMKTMKIDVIIKGLSLYQFKHSKETELKACKSLSEVSAISIEI